MKVTCKVLYNIGEEQYHQSVAVTLETVEPFTVTSRFLSLKVCRISIFSAAIARILTVCVTGVHVQRRLHS